MNATRIETAEHVLPGHPDKLCDAAVDAVVEFIRSGDESNPADPGGQCGLEACAVFDEIHLTGRIATTPERHRTLDIPAIVRRVYREAGYGEDAAGYLWGPDPDRLKVTARLCDDGFQDGERESRHLSDDQAVCIGYARNDSATGFLPPAHWLARRIARNLYDLRLEKGAGEVGPDGKVLVTVRTDGLAWTPLRVSISLHHHEGSSWLFLRRFAEEAVERACTGMPTPAVALNGAGMFVLGGPNGDNGLSGKKLVVDAYGPTVPIGGGAWSGKDLRKVDRLGGLLARSLALQAVGRCGVREALVTLEYTPGCDRPAGISALLDGREEGEALLALLGDPEIRNQAVWEEYVAWGGALPELARWGHQVEGGGWEGEGAAAMV
ncbi:MAG: methionine adenosyltransferase domain-containing protein [Candidatus Krumholzibacteriia bacterium]